MTKKNNNIKSFWALIFFLLSFFAGSYGQNAEKGIFDLRKIKTPENFSLSLDGVWEFYPYKLYSPSDFKNGTPETPEFVSVPSLWSKIVFPNADNPEIGYGTYRLKIKLPEGENYMALRFKRIESSYKVWVNDKPLAETGKPGTDIRSSVPSQKTVTKVFYIDKPEADIIIQVSNFKHRKGGIADSITFGTAEKVLRETEQSVGYEIFLIGVLLIMAIFHLGLYVVRRKDLSLLFFALLLLSETVSLMTNGETLFTLFFPDMKWLTLKRIDYISNFLRISFFILFFYHEYKKYINKYFAYAVPAVSVVLTSVVLFTELRDFAFTLFVFIAVTAISLLYVFYAQIRALMSGKKGSLIPLLGNLILLLTAVNDILLVSGNINSIYLVPAGLFAFIFAQSYLLSFNFSKLYKEAESLNELISDVDNLKNELLKRKSFDLNESTEVICSYLNADRGFLFTVDETEEVSPVSEYPVLEKISEKDYPSSLIKDVLKTGESNITDKISRCKFYDDGYADTYGVNSSITVPLKIKNKTRTIIYLEREGGKPVFTKHEVRVLEELAAQITGLTENAELYEQTQNIRKNLEKIIAARTSDVKNQQDTAEERKSEIETINNRLNETLEEVKTKNEILTENIKAAKLIQKSLLPSKNFLSEQFSDVFILYRPKEIVSGDFYYARKTDDGKMIFAVADCTGHGVPGVLMSLIGHDMLNNAVINKKLTKPSSILEELRRDITEKFIKDENEGQSIKDGMDMAVILFEPETYILEYAGAKIDLLILRNGKLTEVKADKLTVSAEQHERLKDKNFKNYKINLKKGDVLYLATDGFQDQFGGENDTKFMKKNFRALLTEIGDLQFNIQRSRLLKHLNRWQGDKVQNDDITVIGIKV